MEIIRNYVGREMKGKVRKDYKLECKWLDETKWSMKM